jgi:hypothetical protein
MDATRETGRGGGLARRRLLGLLGLAGVAPLWWAGARAADEPPKPGAARAAPATPAAPPPAGAPAEGPSQDAVELAGLARRRYGAYLDEDRIQELTARIDGNLKSAEALRKVKLANADEPDFTFRAQP